MDISLLKMTNKKISMENQDVKCQIGDKTIILTENELRNALVRRYMLKNFGDMVPCFYWDDDEYSEMFYDYDQEKRAFVCECGISVSYDIDINKINYGTLLDAIDELMRKIIDEYYKKGIVLCKYL